MKAYINHIFEMAIPRESDLSKIYYHGTCKTKNAKDIINNGIRPPDLTTRKGKLRPREGKVYITPHLQTAQIYAIGGDMAGHEDWIPSETKDHPVGYLFVIDGKDLKDIEPDEDNIGELIYKIAYEKQKNNKISHEQQNLLDKARYILTPRQLDNVLNGEYADWAMAGKKMIPRLSDAEKLWLIDQPEVHIAHHGIIIPKEAWKIDLNRIKDLKRDASNFFQVAERIK